MTEALSAHRKVGGRTVTVLCCVIYVYINDATLLWTAWAQIVEDEVNNGGCNITGILIGQVSTVWSHPRGVI